MLHTEIQKNLKHNFIVNILDAAFFGAALGFASFVTVIPLFVNSLTNSTTIIGLIASLHIIGWQLPQLFTAGQVARLPIFRPMVIYRTLHERWPFLALAGVALLIPLINHSQVALALTFLFVAWHSLGGGITATAWQSMISKIIPEERRGTFFGLQSAAANLLAALTAVLAGVILLHVEYPYNFALCFFLASVMMALSWVFLWYAREPAHEPKHTETTPRLFWENVRGIMRHDGNFRWFLIARTLGQVAYVAISFYTIYAVREYGMDEQTAGIMTSVLLFAMTLANPVIGWMGDRFGHRRVFSTGLSLMVLSAGLAIIAPGIGWFYLVFALAGCAQAVLWTTTMAMTVEFGGESERPYYIGLGNTLIAPVTILAPFIGGWLVDVAGFHTMFAMTVVAGVIAVAVLQALVADPRRLRTVVQTAAGD
jgi:MFS family permease